MKKYKKKYWVNNETDGMRLNSIMSGREFDTREEAEEYIQNYERNEKRLFWDPTVNDTKEVIIWPVFSIKEIYVREE